MFDSDDEFFRCEECRSLAQSLINVIVSDYHAELPLSNRVESRIEICARCYEKALANDFEEAVDEFEKSWTDAGGASANITQ